MADKLAIALHLDELGVGFIEGGWPGANPKDTEFFARAQTELDLKHATLAAFGATRKAGAKAADDPQVAALRDSEAPVVTLVAKSHDRHVERALRTTLEENLAMVRDTVAHLRRRGPAGVPRLRSTSSTATAYDPAYALEVLRTAAEAGRRRGRPVRHQRRHAADRLGRRRRRRRRRGDRRPARHPLPQRHRLRGRQHARRRRRRRHPRAGHANGYGERTGNADLFTVVANLQLKLGPAGPAGRAASPRATRIAHAIAEVTNVAPDTHQPYVGAAAFAHKAGLHASAIKVDPILYQHIDPARVGNDMRMLVSDMAGPGHHRAQGPRAGLRPGRPSGDLLGRVTERVKELEARGWSFEAADASFELLLRDEVEGERRRHFTVESWRAIVEQGPDGAVRSEATVKIHAGGERIVATGEGNGPVNALDQALRLGLARSFPELERFELVDYKVRILEGAHGTDAVTAGADRDLGRGVVVGHRGRTRERGRGVLAGAGRRDHLRPAAAPGRPDRLARPACIADHGQMVDRAWGGLNHLS